MREMYAWFLEVILVRTELQLTRVWVTTPLKEGTWRGVRNEEVTCSRTAQRRTPSDVPGGMLVTFLRVSASNSDLPLSR